MKHKKQEWKLVRNIWISTKPVLPGVWQRKEGGHVVRARARDGATGHMKDISKVLPDADAPSALKWLTDETLRVRAGRASPEPQKTRFAEFASSLFEEKWKVGEIKSATGRKKWADVLGHLISGTHGKKAGKSVDGFGEMFIDRMHVTHVDGWKAGMAELIAAGDYSPTTVNGWLSVLRVVMKAAKRKLQLPHLVTDGVENFDVSEHATYTEEEPNALLPGAHRKFKRPRPGSPGCPSRRSRAELAGRRVGRARQRAGGHLAADAGRARPSASASSRRRATPTAGERSNAVVVATASASSRRRRAPTGGERSNAVVVATWSHIHGRVPHGAGTDAVAGGRRVVAPLTPTRRAAHAHASSAPPSALRRSTVLRQYGGPRLGLRPGTSYGSPMPRRYARTLFGSVTIATSFIRPLHFGQWSTSIANVRASSSVQRRRAPRRFGFSSGSGSGGASGWSAAFRGAMRARHLCADASTPAYLTV